jgi:hypothetical protein
VPAPAYRPLRHPRGGRGRVRGRAAECCVTSVHRGTTPNAIKNGTARASTP